MSRSNSPLSADQVIESHEDLKEVFNEYADEEGTRLEVVHSPLGLNLHLDDADAVGICPWSEEGRKIEVVYFPYPVSVGELVSYVYMAEDASRIVSRDPEDPFYESVGEWEHDQLIYRKNWSIVSTYLPFELKELVKTFHNDYSKLLNGEEW